MSFMPAPRTLSQQFQPFQRPVSQGGFPRQILSPQAISGQKQFSFQQPITYTPNQRSVSRPVSAQGAPFSSQQQFYPQQRQSQQSQTSTQFYKQQAQPQILRQQQQQQQVQSQQRFNLTAGQQYQPQRFVFQQPNQMLSHKRAAAPQMSKNQVPSNSNQLQNQGRQNNFRSNLSPSPLKTPAIAFQPRNQKAQQVLVHASLANVRTPKKQQEQTTLSNQENQSETQKQQDENPVKQQQVENSSQKKQFMPITAQVDSRGSFRAPRIYTTSAQKPQQQRSVSQQSLQRVSHQQPQFLQSQQQLQQHHQSQQLQFQQKPLQQQNFQPQQQIFRSPSNTKLSQPITAKNQANYFQQQSQFLGSSRQHSQSYQQISPVKLSRAHSPTVRVLNQNHVLTQRNQGFQGNFLPNNSNLQNQSQLNQSKAPQHLLNMETEPKNNKPSVLETVTNQFTSFLDNLL